MKLKRPHNFLQESCAWKFCIIWGSLLTRFGGPEILPSYKILNSWMFAPSFLFFFSFVLLRLLCSDHIHPYDKRKQTLRLFERQLKLSQNSVFFIRSKRLQNSVLKTHHYSKDARQWRWIFTVRLVGSRQLSVKRFSNRCLRWNGDG